MSFLPFLYFIILFFDYGTDSMSNRWTIAYAVLSLWLFVLVYQKHKVFSFCLLSVLLSAVWTISFRWPMWIVNVEGLLTQGIQFSSAVSIYTVLICMLPLLYTPNRYYRHIIGLSSIYSMLHVLVCALLGDRGSLLWGVMKQGSMSGCFTMLTLPFAMELFPKHSVYIVAFAISSILALCAFNSASIPVLCVVAFLVPYLFKRRLVIPVILTGVVAVCLGYYMNPTFLSSSQRFPVYAYTMKWWVDKANIFTGVGLGSYFHLGPFMHQQVELTGQQRWPWLHSDILQGMFDLGVIGLLPFIVAYFYRVYQARYDVSVLSSLLVLVVFSALNYPFRHPVSVVIILMIFFCQHREKELTTS